MRFARGGMRDHIVSHKNDHGASYRRYGVLPWRSRIKINFLRDFRRRSIFDFCNTIEVRADERRAPFDFRKTKGGPWRLATALPSSWEQFASLGRRSSWLRQASPFRIDCFPPAGTIKFNFRKGRPLEQKPWLPSFQQRVRNARSTAARWVRRTAAIRYAVLVRLAFASKKRVQAAEHDRRRWLRGWSRRRRSPLHEAVSCRCGYALAALLFAEAEKNKT